MRVYVVIESTKYESSVLVFKTKRKANNHIRALYKEYSKEYAKSISSNEDLLNVTFNEVSIELYVSELE